MKDEAALLGYLRFAYDGFETLEIYEEFESVSHARPSLLLQGSLALQKFEAVRV